MSRLQGGLAYIYNMREHFRAINLFPGDFNPVTMFYQNFDMEYYVESPTSVVKKGFSACISHKLWCVVVVSIRDRYIYCK